MSAPERRAWQARISHCFSVMQRQTPLFGSAKFGQLSSGWFNVVNQVSRSAQIRALSKTAATCSAAHGVPATSVMSLYARLQGQLGPISSSSADSAKVQAVQAKGASVLAACWAKVINETTALLSGRRAAYLAQNANAIAALESQVDGQVTSLERRYGIKLALVRVVTGERKRLAQRLRRGRGGDRGTPLRERGGLVVGAVLALTVVVGVVAFLIGRGVSTPAQQAARAQAAGSVAVDGAGGVDARAHDRGAAWDVDGWRCDLGWGAGRPVGRSGGRDRGRDRSRRAGR